MPCNAVACSNYTVASRLHSTCVQIKPSTLFLLFFLCQRTIASHAVPLPCCTHPAAKPAAKASRSGRIAAQAKLDELMQGQPPLPPALRGAIADAGTASPALLEHLDAHHLSQLAKLGKRDVRLACLAVQEASMRSFHGGWGEGGCGHCRGFSCWVDVQAAALLVEAWFYLLLTLSGMVLLCM